MNLLVPLLLLSAADGEGGSVMPVLRIGQGPRAAALGEAFIGLADDASALYWNPAGIGSCGDFNFAFSHHEWFAGTTDEVVQVLLPGQFGTVGIGLNYSSEPGIESWDETNLPGDTYAAWNAVGSIGYGVRLFGDNFVGIGFKGFYQSLGLVPGTGYWYRARGYGGCGDIGLLSRPLPFLGFGLTARNLGVAWYGSEFAPMPTEFGFGTSYARGPLNAVFDVVYPFDNVLNVRAGVEYSPVRQLAFRLGYRTGPVDITTLGWYCGFCAGLGVRLGGFSIDYAITPYGELGFAHRLGIQTFVPRHGAGSLRIRTLNAETMQPLWADVTLNGVREFTGQSNRRGELNVTGLRPGRIVIRTSRTGYVPRIDTMLILGDREQHATLVLRPLAYGSLHGTIIDATTGQRLGGTVSYRGPVSGEQSVDPQVGTWMLRDLPAGEYILTATGTDPGRTTQVCTVAVTAGRLAEYDFVLGRRRPETRVTRTGFEAIGFDVGRADITPDAAAVLDHVGRLLNQNARLVVELAGHTDSREISASDYPSNWELSQARAEAVRRYLTDNFGVATERLAARGYADTQPLTPDNTEAGRRQNRRVEFRIIEQ